MLVSVPMHGTLVDLPHARRLPDWDRWQALTADAPPFLTPEFFTLAARFGGDGAFVAEAWDGDRLIGVLPLAHDGDRLRNLSCAYTPGYDYCGAPEGIEEIWRAVRSDPSWNELVLAQVSAGSPLATRLPAIANADGCPAIVRLDSRHPCFALPGFEAALSPKFQTNLQRCARKAGGVELEKLAVPDRAAFDEALAIEAMAWKGAAGTSIATDPRAVHLYRALSRLLGRRGAGALYFLRAGGRRIATLLAVEDRRTLYALKIGYDPAAASLSPGHLLVWKVAAEAQELNEGAQEALDHAVREAKELGAKHLSSWLLAGMPRHEIIKILEHDPAFDLVVMGTHGRSGLGRILLGSIAEGIVRHAPCSVLTVRPDAKLEPFTRVLCPVDFSERAEHAVELAAALVQPESEGITLLHVTDVPPVYGNAKQTLDFLRDLDKYSTEHLATWATRLEGKTPAPVAKLSRVGYPGAEILQLLDEDPAFDLVVIGSHGRTGIERILLGSVAEKVVRHAKCPVLVARRRTKPR